MRKITCISSFNKEYFHHTGKIFLDTWLKHWDTNFDLVLYTEGFSLPESPRYKQIPFTQLSEDYYAFQEEKIKNRAKIFAKKAYSIIHAMENIDTDILIWLDADTATKENVTYDFFEDIIPNFYLSAHLGVWHHIVKHDFSSPQQYSCETGFFALNKNHKEYKNFYNLYKGRYTKRQFNDLRRPYDGDVYGAVVKQLEKQGKEDYLHDMNPEKHKTPFPRCILKDKLYHFKHRAKQTENFEKHYQKYIESQKTKEK